MAYSKVEKTALDMAAPIAEGMGCYIYDVEYVKEGGLWFLRVFADKDGGISLDECEELSCALSAKLDKNDPTNQNYYLEVSSPGIERKLKEPWHFEKYMGENIDIGLYKAIGGQKQITARLKGFDGKSVTVEYDNDELIIPLKQTTSVKLHFDF